MIDDLIYSLPPCGDDTAIEGGSPAVRLAQKSVLNLLRGDADGLLWFAFQDDLPVPLPASRRKFVYRTKHMEAFAPAFFGFADDAAGEWALRAGFVRDENGGGLPSGARNFLSLQDHARHSSIGKELSEVLYARVDELFYESEVRSLYAAAKGDHSVDLAEWAQRLSEPEWYLVDNPYETAMQLARRVSESGGVVVGGFRFEQDLPMARRLLHAVSLYGDARGWRNGGGRLEAVEALERTIMSKEAS
jgi:hypothetical protein